MCHIYIVKATMGTKATQLLSIVVIALVMAATRRRRTPGPEGPNMNEVSFRTRPHHNMHGCHTTI
jgi:hypothetical protein